MAGREEELIGLLIHLIEALCLEGYVAPALCWRVK